MRRRRERVEAEPDRQLVELNHRLQDMANKSAADRLRLEQEVREKLEEQTRELHGQMKGIKNGTEGLEARVKEMEQGAKKERERAQAEYRRQLADLAGRLQGENKVCLVHRMRLEQEIRELQDRVTTTIAMSPHPTPYV